jgi:hypothetical protein
MTGMKFRIHHLVAALIVVLCAPRAVAAQKSYVPRLGSKVPAYVLRARTKSQQCVTETGRRDPCASVVIAKIRFTIGWDAITGEITYLFTDDPDLIMDSELSVGGSCRLVGAALLASYKAAI